MKNADEFLSCLILLTSILAAEHAKGIVAVGGRRVKCSCTASYCASAGGVCSTEYLCYVQVLRRDNDADPVTRGCISGNTPLLCENRLPLSVEHSNWPYLRCCGEDFCNDGPYHIPTTATSTIATVATSVADQLNAFSQYPVAPTSPLNVSQSRDHFMRWLQAHRERSKVNRNVSDDSIWKLNYDDMDFSLDGSSSIDDSSTYLTAFVLALSNPIVFSVTIVSIVIVVIATAIGIYIKTSWSPVGIDNKVNYRPAAVEAIAINHEEIGPLCDDQSKTHSTIVLNNQ